MMPIGKAQDGGGQIEISWKDEAGLLFVAGWRLFCLGFTVLWLMIPLFLSAFLTVFLLWILCQLVSVSTIS